MKNICQYNFVRNDLTIPSYFLLVATELNISNELPPPNEFKEYYSSLNWQNIKTTLIMKSTNQSIHIPAHSKMDFFNYAVWFVFPLSESERKTFVEQQYEQERPNLFKKIKSDINHIVSQVRSGKFRIQLKLNTEAESYLRTSALKDLNNFKDSLQKSWIQSANLQETEKEHFRSNLSSLLTSLANIFRISYSFYRKYKQQEKENVFKKIASQYQKMIFGYLELLNKVVLHKNRIIYIEEGYSSQLLLEKDQVILLYLQVRDLLKKNKENLTDEITKDILDAVQNIQTILDKYKEDEEFQFIHQRSIEIKQTIESQRNNNNDNQCKMQ